ncbi:MAG: ribosome-binding factor A [uncultured bacterium]|nr:MAG: ribosome-binding factor A [uncultured bacterium]
MTKGFKRDQRINDVVQQALAEIIQKEAKDLRFGMVTITGVNVSHDLAFAKVFVSVLEEDKADETIAALNNAAKYLRYLLANAVELRITPELKFVYDDSIARGSRISSLINDALKK